jgi:hypothetical protein
MLLFFLFSLGIHIFYLTHNESQRTSTYLVENGKQILIEGPDVILPIVAWILTTFCLLHFFPAKRKRKRLLMQVDAADSLI